MYKNLRNAAPGSDKIYASMQKNLQSNSINNLLPLFNAILQQGLYPLVWKRAIILPILKPTKDPSIPSSYRHISLSSVLAKLFQKILNKRLFWFLESNNRYGFRKGLKKPTAVIRNYSPYSSIFKKHSPVSGAITSAPNYMK